jgi:tRNA(fMet)-specific endonuclease VapC
MALFVLDTDILVLFQEGDANVLNQVLMHPMDDLAVTAISIEEQLSGWYTLLRRSKDPKRLARAYQRLVDTVHTLNNFRLLSFTEPAIARFEQLKRLKLGVKYMDLRIAAIALEFGGTLVTRNAVDFHNVPGLLIENWAAP